jgi:TonB family protein
MQTAPSPLAATEESKPLAEPNTEERAQSTPAEAPAVQKTSEILQGSVSTEMSRYPAIRISPELKKQAAQSGASLQIGEPISQLSPVYPEEAERQGIEGTVQLRALVGKDGAVENVEVVNGPSLLATAAVNAIRQWHFRPTLLGDQPIEVTEEITVVFRVRKTSAAGN